MGDRASPQPTMSDATVRATTHPVTTFLIRHVASHLDPRLFRATNGRLTTFGAPVMPMVTLSTRGARTGKRHLIHLACLEHEGDRLVVASAMGQKRHPGWSYNLEAHPEIEVQAPGERYRARAERLTDGEKAEVWPAVHAAIPQMAVYETRTERNIRMYRLRRVE